MATYLYRLGRFSFQRRRLILALWLAALALLGVGAFTLSGPTSDEFSIPGTEAQEAMDLLGERFPGAAADGAQARVVFAAPPGEKLTDGTNKAAIAQVVDQLKTGAAGRHGLRPAQGHRQRGGHGRVRPGDLQGAGDRPDRRRPGRRCSAPPTRAADAGLTVEVGGDAVAGAAAGRAHRDHRHPGRRGRAGDHLRLAGRGRPAAADRDHRRGRRDGAASRSPPASSTSRSSTSTLALMLGLAVGIDYALFIVSRYRHELANGRDRRGGGRPGRRHGRLGGGLRRPDRRHRPGGAGGGRHPDADQDGPGGRRRGRHRRPHRAHPAARRCSASPARRSRRQARPATPRRDRAQARPWARAGRASSPRRPVAVLLPAVVGLGVIAVPAPRPAAGLPDDGMAAAGHHPAQGVRPAVRGLRPRLQRPADGRRRRRGQRRPEGRRRRTASTTIKGLRGRRRGHPGDVQQGRRHRDRCTSSRPAPRTAGDRGPGARHP